jgi:hypothetical protein
MENALNWLRGNGVNVDDEDFTFESFNTLPQKTPSVNSPELRYKDRDDALNWLRGGSVDGIDDQSATIFEKIDSYLPNKEGQTEVARANEMENALNWLRGNGADVEDEDFTFESFDTLPQKTSSVNSPELRYKDRDDALNWLRGGTVDGIDDPSATIFEKIDS